MTFMYLILPKIIYLNTVSEYLNFVHVTFKLSILSNHIKYPKRLVPYYKLPFFRIKKERLSIIYIEKVLVDAKKMIF